MTGGMGYMCKSLLWFFLKSLTKPFYSLICLKYFSFFTSSSLPRWEGEGRGRGGGHINACMLSHSFIFIFYLYIHLYSLRSTKEERFLIFWVACYRVGSLCTQAKGDPCFFVPWFTFSAPFWMTSQFRTQAKADPCFFVPWFTFSAPFWMTSQFRCAKHSASCFAVCRTCWKVQAYCCLVGKLFCHVVKKFRRCKLSKPEESVCHFWTLYINQIVFCFERFAMFDRTDPLWSQIKSAKCRVWSSRASCLGRIVQGASCLTFVDLVPAATEKVSLIRSKCVEEYSWGRVHKRS